MYKKNNYYYSIIVLIYLKSIYFIFIEVQIYLFCFFMQIFQFFSINVCKYLL